jgi:hypothetical protein
VSARLTIGILAFILWGTLITLTLYDLIENGPSILVLISLVFVGILGIGVFGALGERRGGPR